MGDPSIVVTGSQLNNITVTVYVQSNLVNVDTEEAIGCPYYIVSGLNLEKNFPFPIDLRRKQTVRNIK